ncbi:peroxidase 4 [Quercus suber]|uniref:peroxidase n=1 Tax=Quercus suber TaxID=58331 RepID=A0AAW0KR13_QUESU
MASKTHIILVTLLSILSLLAYNSVYAQLSPNFYATTCPNLRTLVQNAMRQAVTREARMGASILRLFFHDCFVNGCDASILLDDTATFTGEKNAQPNLNSTRGFKVIDTIKTRVEASCNATVSCADILALAAREGVVLVSLNAREMTALSGGHTIGQARCSLFRTRIYNETNIDSNFDTTRKANCPATGGDSNLAPLDSLTSTRFDNNYYKDLVARRGLLHSDQQLFNNGSQDAVVRTYSNNNAAFASDFAAAMVKMSNLSPLTRTNGEIRRNCKVVN